MELRVIFASAVIILLVTMLYLSTIAETDIEKTRPTIDTELNNTQTEEEQQPEKEGEESEFVDLVSNFSLGTREIWGEAAIKVPAVDNEGNGVVTWLAVDVIPGEGRTLVNINQLLFWVDTQYSIQTAKWVAENYTKMNLSDVDIVYAIDTEASLVEGPSAGAALTVATVAALRNQTLDESIMITGTIKPDGMIGPVGGIIEKAKASKDVGATTFLVPEGQSVEISYNKERECEKIGPILYCTTDYVPEYTNVEDEVGIEIEEVSTLGEALKYFLE